MLAFGAIPRLGRRELLAVAVFAILILAFLPIVVHKAVWLGQDVEVFFRAGWAIWTGYPLYQVFDHHGWTYHYPPTFALFMGLFANPLPDHPQPWWALPYPVAVAVWYLINVACLFVALHIWARAVEQARPIEANPAICNAHSHWWSGRCWHFCHSSAMVWRADSRRRSCCC